MSPSPDEQPGDHTAGARPGPRPGGRWLESRPIDPHDGPSAPVEPAPVVGLSIALCTFQGERWLPDLLGSIAGQSRLPDELVACDDGSDDGTLEVLEAFAATAPFPVRIERNAERLGSTRNFAAAVSRCQGAIIALADQDDVWYPGKLAVLEWEFAMDPTVSMVFSDGDLIDVDGQPLGRRLWDTRLIGRTLRAHPVVPEELFARRALTTGCTMALRRRVVEAAVPFPPELDDPSALMRHDRWLSLVAAAMGTVRAIADPLLALRVHADQETGVLVGGELRRALRRSAGRVLDRTPAAERAARAAQLQVAAARAEEVGDFREAAALRAIAEHQQARAEVGGPGHGPTTVLRSAAAGTYTGDPLAPLAIAADVVRSVRHRTPGPDPEPARAEG